MKTPLLLRLAGLAIGWITCHGWGQPASHPPVTLPVGAAPQPLGTPHFPSRQHAFVFRNWNLVTPRRMADLLATAPDKITELAMSMGLVSHPVPEEFYRRGYITLLRRNWHLLPYEQLMRLVEMSPRQLATALLEDDFLFIKFGRLKPDCPPLLWREPTPEQRDRAEEIRLVLRSRIGGILTDPGEPRFQFLESFQTPAVPSAAPALRSDQKLFDLRFIYSYCGLFGDALMDPTLASYPEGMLQRLADKGVNGIWIHTVLRHLAPGRGVFSDFGAGHEMRLATLRALVKRAAKYGVGVYLYLNEPRALPRSMFETRPECAGVREGEVLALCTSVGAVREWLQSSLAHVFRETPGLAGAFTITASENLTHCASHGNQHLCSRCRNREYDELIAEVNTLIERGVHQGNSNAKVIAWDWGWHGHGDAPGIINRLSPETWLMSVSEWGLPIHRGGITSRIGEYSISAVGPGPRATRHWQLARERGLKTVAKVQLNATWELSTLPYLPVLDLVADHCERLARAGVDGMMLSWTLGGYPSPNLEIARQFSVAPIARPDAVLDALARKRYGNAGATNARRAWSAFSDAFQEYPYHGAVVYNAPVQIGPANLLYLDPTGYRATMTGLPYDDLESWRGPYPPDVFAEQFDLLVQKWQQGIGFLENAVAAAPSARRVEAEDELRFARSAHAIFRSVRNQVRFVQLRNNRGQNRAAIGALLDDEIESAGTLYRLAKADSRIGFEAANQYFFVPNDLLEKILNCEDLKSRMGR